MWRRLHTYPFQDRCPESKIFTEPISKPKLEDKYASSIDQEHISTPFAINDMVKQQGGGLFEDAMNWASSIFNIGGERVELPTTEPPPEPSVEPPAEPPAEPEPAAEPPSLDPIDYPPPSEPTAAAPGDVRDKKPVSSLLIVLIVLLIIMFVMGVTERMTSRPVNIPIKTGESTKARTRTRASSSQGATRVSGNRVKASVGDIKSAIKDLVL